MATLYVVVPFATYRVVLSEDHVFIRPVCGALSASHLVYEPSLVHCYTI